MYAYCLNIPINYEDPTGRNVLKKLMSAFAKTTVEIKKKTETAIVGTGVKMSETVSLLNNDFASTFLGNISYTVTTGTADNATIIFYNEFNGDNVSGGISLNSQYSALSVQWRQTEASLGLSIKDLSLEVGVGLKSGVSFSVGVEIGDTTHKVTFSVGWGTILLWAIGAVVSMFAPVPIVALLGAI